MAAAIKPWSGFNRDAPVHHVGYAKVEQLVATLAEHVRASEVDYVVGIARSGIVPATMLSQRLGRELYLLRCQRHASEVSWMGEPPPAGASLLLVDDIVSRGLTMRAVAEHLTDSGYVTRTLALFVDRQRASFAPDIALDAPGFIRFPWDRRETTPDARAAIAQRELLAPVSERECFGVDMDGVLLPDIRKAHYRKDLQLALRRRQELAVYPSPRLPNIDWNRAHIVTGRPAADFAMTRQWLDASGFSLCPLYCRSEQRHDHSVAATIAHKVETLTRIGVSTFFESELIQATLIAKACPTVDVIWWGREHRLRLGGVAQVAFDARGTAGEGITTTNSAKPP